jgi:hypothetical protein
LFIIRRRHGSRFDARCLMGGRSLLSGAYFPKTYNAFISIYLTFKVTSLT